ncbi:MAG: DUF1800 family protein [Ilumatobacter sp.]|nr:DUF1800 family protein [Ilumatobacter sp.]
MDSRQAVGWLHRRAGFGLHPDALDAAVERGPDAELARLLAPPEPGTDPWAGLELDPMDGGRIEAIVGWLARMITTTAPYSDRRTWNLHGWLVSSMEKVNQPILMVEQIRMFMERGGGPVPDLLRALTADRAMLVYLDGRTSTGDAPNENYGRELLELFALGVGNYTEDDVLAAARALTGWVANPRGDGSVFVGFRHDDTPQTLLGVTGVHDLDTVIDAVVADPAHPRFVAERVAQMYLGDLSDALLADVVDDLAATYVAGGMELDAVIARALRLGLDGATTPVVAAPIPWLVTCMRACGVPYQRALRSARNGLGEMGQVPLVPPSVAGWPTGTEWFTSSSLVARTNVAAAVAGETAADQPVMIAAGDDDLDRLAQHLALPEPFSAATTAAIRSAPDPTARLALALVCPENLLS